MLMHPLTASPPCGQDLPEDNFPEVVLLACLNARKCHMAARGQIFKKEVPSPQKILHFHMQVHCKYGKDQKNKGMVPTLWQHSLPLSPCHV